MFKQIAVLLLLTIAGAGCSQQTIDSAQHDAAHDATVVGQTTQQAVNDVKPQIKELGLGARVTTALRANANLPTSIRVDASPDGVRLRGNVKTAEQKQLAGHIAKETVPAGKTVSNELTVEGA